ncbi:G2 M phase-specific E3 ubiquitin- ligase, partial [Paramuricea clavata]
MSLSEGLARLRAIRGGHRAVLTKYLNELEELLATAEISEESLMRLEVLKQQIDGKQRTLNELDAKILNEIKIEDVEKEIDESEAIDIKVTVARERIERAKKQHATPQHTNIVENSQNTNDHGSTLLSQEEVQFKIRCVYCNTPHYSASCPTVTDLTKRREILVNAKRCFKCLRQGHEVRDCRNPKLCRNCGGRHHQSICSKGFIPRNLPEKNEPNKNEPNKDEQNKDKGAGNVGSKDSTLTVGNLVTSKRHVLLQTARAVATNEDGSKTCPVRILFDSGSQRSYLTDDLKRKLNLNPIKTETLYLNTFGDSKHERKSCQLFNLNLRDRDNEITPIWALNFPVICSPLPSTVDIFDYQHIRGLDLADSSEIQDDHHSDTVDVLIGSDHYWSFMYGETIRGDSGPVAVSSKFGWVLSGQTELTNERGVRRKESSANLVISSCTEDFLNDNVPQNDQLVDCLKRFWETEAIGIADSDDLKTNPVPNNFIEDIAFDGRNYE